MDDTSQETSAKTGKPATDKTERGKRQSPRRRFLKAIGGTVGAATLTLAGCDTMGNGGGGGGSDGGVNSGSESGTVDSLTLDFSTDFGVLNFAYLLEQLESRFYSIACKGPNSPYDGINELERYYLSALDKHEGTHDAFLMKAIPDDERIPDDLEFDFSDVDFSDRGSVLSTARTLEDVGVSAYNGAADFLEDPFFLLYAGKIVSVEARHAAAIRQTFFDDPEAFADLDSNRGSVAPLSELGTVPDQGLDAALAPTEVLPLAAPFLTFDVTVEGT